jgi:ribonuclease P/MRP protein subunit POP5
MKGLPPALRKRKRYIAFRLIANGELEAKEVVLAIRENIISLFGEYFSTHSGIWLEYFDGKHGILKCYHTALEKVKVAITLMGKIGEKEVIPIILGVSGTIKRCRKYLEVLRNASTTDGLRQGHHGIQP